MEDLLNPLVSIIIPVYNTEKYIRATLESAQSQTYKNFECLIVLDGSTDNSAKIALEFVDRDSRFVLLEKSNGGLASARNFGINKAKGEYISFLDSDDTWKPDKLEVQIAKFLNTPTADLIFSNCEIIEDSRVYIYDGIPYSGNPLELLYSNTVTGSGSSVIIKKTAVEHTGLFQEALRSFEDLEYWYRAALRGINFVYIDKVGVSIYKRSSSLSSNKITMMQANKACFAIQLKELTNTSYPIYEIHKAAIIRIKGCRKYFIKDKYILNLTQLLSLTIIYIKFLLNRTIVRFRKNPNNEIEFITE